IIRIVNFLEGRLATRTQRAIRDIQREAAQVIWRWHETESRTTGEGWDSSLTSIGRPHRKRAVATSVKNSIGRWYSCASKKQPESRQISFAIRRMRLTPMYSSWLEVTKAS